MLVLYPQQADKAKISLLTGLAKLIAADTAAEGEAMLKKIAAEQPESPVGRAAVRIGGVRARGGMTPATLDASPSGSRRIRRSPGRWMPKAD